METSLKGKTAIVTGGDRGAGFGMAVGLAQADVNLVIISENRKRLDDAVNEISRATMNENIVGIQSNIRSIQSIDEVMDKVSDQFGKVDILVNCPGSNKRITALEYTEKEWDEVQDSHLKYSFFMCQTVAKQMIEKEIAGKIINMIPLVSQMIMPDMIAYCAAGGAIVQMTKAMANEWAQYGINVNAIGVGYCETETAELLTIDEKRRSEILSRIPQGRCGIPSDLAGTAVFFASEASNYITGQILHVDGGCLCS